VNRDTVLARGSLHRPADPSPLWLWSGADRHRTDRPGSVATEPRTVHCAVAAFFPDHFTEDGLKGW